MIPTDTEAAEAAAAERARLRMMAFAKESIERDYAARGEKPVVSGGMLISRSLVETVREQKRRRAELGGW